MTENAEQSACEVLCAALAPVPVGGLVELRAPYDEVLGFLEGFVTWVLREGQGWPYAIDGIFPRSLVKVGDREVLLVGTCLARLRS